LDPLDRFFVRGKSIIARSTIVAAMLAGKRIASRCQNLVVICVPVARRWRSRFSAWSKAGHETRKDRAWRRFRDRSVVMPIMSMVIIMMGGVAVMIVRMAMVIVISLSCTR
jgi:hypothetical protein